MPKIDEIRAALLSALSQRYAAEKQFEETTQQVHGLMNQLHILQALEAEKTAAADKPNVPRPLRRVTQDDSGSKIGGPASDGDPSNAA